MDFHNQSIIGLFPLIVLFSITFISHRTAIAEDNDAELLKYRNSYRSNKGVPQLRGVDASRRYKRGIIDFDPGNRATKTTPSTTTSAPPPPTPDPSLFTSATTVSTLTKTTTQTPTTKSTSSAANTTKTTKELPDNTTTVSPPPSTTPPGNTTLPGSTTPPSNTTSTGSQLTDQASLCLMSTCIFICNFVL